MTPEDATNGLHARLEEPSGYPDHKSKKIELARAIIASFTECDTQAARNWPRGPFAYASDERRNQGETE
jgi:hypothetical protein